MDPKPQVSSEIARSQPATRLESPTDAMVRIVQHVTTSTYADLSPAAIEATKTFVMDSLGVAFAGTLAPGVQQTLRILRKWGGAEESTVLRFGDRLPVWAAAMMNSFLMHNQEFDCVHDRAVVHPLTTVLPTALAIAEEKHDVTGRDLLVAVALGVDVVCLLGAGSRAPMRHFRPGTAGAFGAIAAAGKILGFDEGTLANAMGVVYSQISGTLQAHHEGVAVNSMQTAFNARAAVTAIALASEGLPGPRHVLEGRYGYFPLFEGAYDLNPELERLGRRSYIEEVSHKPFPCGRLTHGLVEGALRSRSEYGIHASQVVRCRATVPPMVQRLVGKSPADAPRLSAQFAKLSIPFVVATALCRGQIFVDAFGDAALADAEVLSLAARVEVVQDDVTTDENAITPVRLDIHLDDGRIVSTSVAAPLGSPGNPLSPDQQLAKFRRCVLAAGDPAPARTVDAIAETVRHLERVPRIDEVIEMMVPAG